MASRSVASRWFAEGWTQRRFRECTASPASLLDLERSCSCKLSESVGLELRVDVGRRPHSAGRRSRAARIQIPSDPRPAIPRVLRGTRHGRN